MPRPARCWARSPSWGLRILEGDGLLQDACTDRTLHRAGPATLADAARWGEREIMVPAVPQFIAETDVEGGYIRVNMMEGL